MVSDGNTQLLTVSSLHCHAATLYCSAEEAARPFSSSLHNELNLDLLMMIFHYSSYSINREYHRNVIRPKELSFQIGLEIKVILRAHLAIIMDI